jgi:hypothetical protein
MSNPDSEVVMRLDGSGEVRTRFIVCLVIVMTILAARMTRALEPASGGLARNPLLDLAPKIPIPPSPFGRQVHFVPNTFAFWNNPSFATTQLPPGCAGGGCAPIPAYANILLQNSNFVQCKGGPFALCYYSGPNTAGNEPTNLSCELTPDGKFANCDCYAIPYGTYFVDINAILNYNVYLQTVATCGRDGALCENQPNKAPVCNYVNNQTLIPKADMFSTFSFDCLPTDGIGATNCTQAVPYAGCMTAPCYKNKDTDKTGIVTCSCPVYNGPFQIGQDNQQCSLGDNLIWSAANNPSATGTTPTTTGCYPDTPGALGCPLLPPEPPAYVPPAGISCQKVCQQYTTCRNGQGVEAGYTCDSTLCTAQCNDRDLSQQACAGLTSEGRIFGACDISEIAKAEEAAGCSCCASQLCGCEANNQTNKAIYKLVQAQTARGITSQCDQNGTLCGSKH